jgi:glycosyltransferase involved in cell wall biosynthesis
MSADCKHLALFISGLSVGGVERSMLKLAHELAARGHRVDLVVANTKGLFRSQVSSLVRLVDIEDWWMRLPWIRNRKRRRALVSAPALARYLRRERPHALLSASHYVNLAALWGRRLAGTRTRLVISQQTQLSRAIANTSFPGRRRPLLGWMVRHFYAAADTIVAVSNGVADDLAAVATLPRPGIHTIYNPVVTPELMVKAREPLDHPWFTPGAPPAVLAVGRLAEQKDFPTLLRAFTRVRAIRLVRLLILGEGGKRRELEALATALGVAGDVALPGVSENPFAYMARAAVFVLSSAYEGLPTVLIEALACGCPVVSTDCPSGPAEILAGGAYGPLVPVGDDAALAKAILSVLETPPDPDRLRARAALFSVDRAADRYLDVLLGGSLT